MNFFSPSSLRPPRTTLRSSSLRSTSLNGGKILFCLLALLAFACAGRTPAPRLLLPPPSDEWTRKIEIHDALDLQLHGKVHYFSRAVRLAAVADEAKAHHLTETEVRARESDQLEEWGKFAEFRLSVFTVKRSWNDFDRVDSKWRIYLVQEGTGAKLRPESVQGSAAEFAEESSPAPWNRGYRIRFERPRDPGGEPLPDSALLESYSLVLTSALGEAAVRW